MADRGFLNHIWYKLLDEEGRPISNAEVYIYTLNLNLLTIYEADGLTEITQPIVTTSGGVFEFYVQDDIGVPSGAVGHYPWDTEYIISWNDGLSQSGIIEGDALFGRYAQVDETDSSSTRVNKAISNFIGWTIQDHIDFMFGTTDRCGSSSSSSSSDSSSSVSSSSSSSSLSSSSSSSSSSFSISSSSSSSSLSSSSLSSSKSSSSESLSSSSSSYSSCADQCTEGFAIGQENPTYYGSAFDNVLIVGDAGGSWYAWDGGYITTGWTGQDFGAGNEKTINRYRLYTTLPTRVNDPKDWTFEASNTGAWSGEEVILDTVTGASFTEDTWQEFTFTNTNAYRYYRINVTANNGGSFLIITEIEMYECY